MVITVYHQFQCNGSKTCDDFDLIESTCIGQCSDIPTTPTNNPIEIVNECHKYLMNTCNINHCDKSIAIYDKYVKLLNDNKFLSQCHQTNMRFLFLKCDWQCIGLTNSNNILYCKEICISAEKNNEDVLLILQMDNNIGMYIMYALIRNLLSEQFHDSVCTKEQVLKFQIISSQPNPHYLTLEILKFINETFYKQYIRDVFEKDKNKITKNKIDSAIRSRKIVCSTLSSRHEHYKIWSEDVINMVSLYVLVDVFEPTLGGLNSEFHRIWGGLKLKYTHVKTIEHMNTIITGGIEEPETANKEPNNIHNLLFIDDGNDGIHQLFDICVIEMYEKYFNKLCAMVIRKNNKNNIKSFVINNGTIKAIVGICVELSMLNASKPLSMILLSIDFNNNLFLNQFRRYIILIQLNKNIKTAKLLERDPEKRLDLFFKNIDWDKPNVKVSDASDCLDLCADILCCKKDSKCIQYTPAIPRVYFKALFMVIFALLFACLFVLMWYYHAVIVATDAAMKLTVESIGEREVNFINYHLFAPPSLQNVGFGEIRIQSDILDYYYVNDTHRDAYIHDESLDYLLVEWSYYVNTKRIATFYLYNNNTNPLIGAYKYNNSMIISVYNGSCRHEWIYNELAYAISWILSGIMLFIGTVLIIYNIKFHRARYFKRQISKSIDERRDTAGHSRDSFVEPNGTKNKITFTDMDAKDNKEEDECSHDEYDDINCLLSLISRMDVNKLNVIMNNASLLYELKDKYDPKCSYNLMEILTEVIIDPTNDEFIINNFENILLNAMCIYIPEGVSGNRYDTPILCEVLFDKYPMEICKSILNNKHVELLLDHGNVNSFGLINKFIDWECIDSILGICCNYSLLIVDSIVSCAKLFEDKSAMIINIRTFIDELLNNKLSEFNCILCSKELTSIFDTFSSFLSVF